MATRAERKMARNERLKTFEADHALRIAKENVRKAQEAAAKAEWERTHPVSCGKIPLVDYVPPCGGRRLLAIIAFTAILMSARAGVTDLQAERALYGETAGESYACKEATGEALRNRIAKYHDLRGVYGKSSPLLNHIDAKAWSACVKAWNESATNNIVGKAYVWGSKDDLRKASFYSRMTKVATIGGHTFFK
jgi:hypothetical protein